MQKSKKFLYLTLLTSSSSSWRIESRQVENMSNSTQVKLKMWAIQLNLDSSSKCQLKTRLDDQSSDREQSWIQSTARFADELIDKDDEFILDLHFRMKKW